MPKNKVSEWSSTASNNTDIGGINIAEGCAPSGINNAIRELMAQVKDMQTGTDSDNLVVGGGLTVSGNTVLSGTVSAAGAVTLTTALGVTSGGTGVSTVTTGDILYSSAVNTLAKLAAVTTGNVLLSGTTPSWGKVALASAVSGTLPIANGGTGATTASAAINALVPTQTSNADKYLKTDGTSVSWAAVTTSGGTVTSVAAGNGMTFSTITSSGTVTLGTPSTLTTSTTNSATAGTHTHSVTFPVTSLKGQSSDTALTGDMVLTSLASFGKSLGANGYQKLPGGLIIQWGFSTIGGAGSVAITFPTAFSSACYCVIVADYQAGDTGGVSTNSVVAAYSTTGTTISTNTNTDGFFWLAVGQ